MGYSGESYGQILGGAQMARQASPVDSETPSQIRDAVGVAEQCLSDLHDQIAALERRLETVLSPAPPQVARDNAKAPTPTGSHLLGRLLIVDEGFRFACERLSAIRNRVEI